MRLLKPKFRNITIKSQLDKTVVKISRTIYLNINLDFFLQLTKKYSSQYK